MNTLPDCVFDCMVFVQAVMRANGPAAELLRHFEAGRLRLHTSREVLAEVGTVLHYPTLRAKLPSLTEVQVTAFLERVRWRSTYHREVPLVIDLPRDPKDERYLNLAVEAEADVLTTRDADLLDLVHGRDNTAKKLRQLAPRLQILTPESLLQTLRA